MRMRAAGPVLVVLALAALGTSACGRAALAPSAVGLARPMAKLGAREASAATALGRAAQKALAALAEANLAYKGAGLDRGGARKLDAKGAAAVRQAALAVAEKLALAATSMEAELAAGQADDQALGKAWAAKAPRVGDAPPPGEDVAAALYHVAQWRLKFSALIEQAYRSGALPAPGQGQSEGQAPPASLAPVVPSLAP